MIKEYLLKYKSITEVIIVNIKNDLDVEKHMEEREELLKLILEDKNFKKEEIKNIYLDLNLDKLDKKLKEEINKSIQKNKEELKTIKNQRNANNTYEKNINKMNFLNKKI